MRLDVGPVEPASAAAWIQWADETLAALRQRSGTGAASLPAEVLDELRRYVEQWKPKARSMHRNFRWHGEIEPDELEHLVHAFFTLDAQLSHELQGERSAAPDRGRDFYLVLVRALLHALEMDSPSRAAFADQLRSSWPIAVAAI